MPWPPPGACNACAALVLLHVHCAFRQQCVLSCPEVRTRIAEEVEQGQGQQREVTVPQDGGVDPMSRKPLLLDAFVSSFKETLQV